MAKFPKTAVMSAYQNAPDLVREAFNSEKTIDTIRDIRTRYNLHIDTAGTLGENVGYMLVGLLSPSEFFGEMVLSGVDQETAKGVLEALNTRIFIPLSKQIKSPQENPASAPIKSYQTPLAEKIVSERPIMPAPALVSPPQPTAPRPEIPQYNLMRPDVQAGIRTMNKDMAIAQSTPQTQGIASAALTHTVQPEHATPSSSFQTASIPVPMSAPVIQPIPRQAEPQIPAFTPIPQTPATPATGKDLFEQQASNEYKADPYRESV